MESVDLVFSPSHCLLRVFWETEVGLLWYSLLLCLSTSEPAPRCRESRDPSVISIALQAFRSNDASWPYVPTQAEELQNQERVLMGPASHRSPTAQQPCAWSQLHAWPSPVRPPPPPIRLLFKDFSEMGLQLLCPLCQMWTFQKAVFFFFLQVWWGNDHWATHCQHYLFPRACSLTIILLLCAWRYFPPVYFIFHLWNRIYVNAAIATENGLPCFSCNFERDENGECFKLWGWENAISMMQKAYFIS